MPTPTPLARSLARLFTRLASLSLLLLLPLSACDSDGGGGDVDPCEELACPAEATCDTGVCVCPSGFVLEDGACVEAPAGGCQALSDCDDGVPCNGVETCGDDGECQPGTPVSCPEHAACDFNGECACEAGYVMGAGACHPVGCEEAADCDDGDPCNGEERCGAAGTCLTGDPVVCSEHEICVPASGACACDEGFVDAGEGCVALCEDDAACDDGDPCDGLETCSEDGLCAPGEPMVCGSGAVCDPEGGACGCLPGYDPEGEACVISACPVPQAPTFVRVHAGAEIAWTTPQGYALEIGSSADPAAALPDEWSPGQAVTLPMEAVPTTLRLFARVTDPLCEGVVFAHTYAITPVYASSALDEGSGAVPWDASNILGWATGWVDPVEYGTEVLDDWKTPEEALGPAGESEDDVLVLGNGGRAVLTFDPPVIDGEGPDLAVFENAVNDTFLELAFVEVSSDGQVFVRFDAAYLGDEPVAQYGGHDAALINGLAGKLRGGFGVPFDLALLAQRPEVLDGTVDLGAIAYVRLVDVIGDGSASDSFGHPIYDPTPTVESGGFDLDGVAVLNQAQGGAPLTGPATVSADALELAQESAWDGSDGSGGVQVGPAWLANDYDAEYGSWEGFAVSTMTDTTTPGWENQFSAITGEGAEGSAAYFVGYGYSGSFTGYQPEILFPYDPDGLIVDGAFLTNTTQAALSMLAGDAYAKKFGGADGTDPDWFLLTVTGVGPDGEVSGAVEVYLADYRYTDPADDYVLGLWEWVDLSSLGAVVGLQFDLASTDVGDWGVNTPAYFALDGLHVTPPGFTQ
jgi:hypothetical protein